MTNPVRAAVPLVSDFESAGHRIRWLSRGETNYRPARFDQLIAAYRAGGSRRPAARVSSASAAGFTGADHASPITPALLRRSMDIFGCDFVQFYGMTETSGGSTCLTAKDHDRDGPRQHLLRSAGKPLVNVEVRIVGTDSGERLPAGEVGEVQTHSPPNTPGYFDRPLDNAALLTNDGWLRR